MARLSIRIAGSLGLAAALYGCGPKASGDSGGGPPVGQVEGAFLKAAQATGIPSRFLMAVGYLESRLASQNATANYISIGNGDQSVPRGTLMTQTAFGMTFQTLGLDPAKAQSQLLETQIDAYAHWLAGQFKSQGVSLAVDPSTQEDKFFYIENMALLHRKGLQQRRNVQILFARELITILNQGFLWQDPRSGEKLTLEMEKTPIDINKFDQDGKNWFGGMQLSDDAQFHEATYLPLVTVPSDEFVNKPNHVEVIHCPLTLSACLELQTRTQESDVHLAAHYVIPPIVGGADASTTDPVLNRILQVADHKDALILTDDKGDNVPVEDAIIIMLVGNSGRIVAGARSPADPTWFTDLQLRGMGQLINDICTLLAQKDTTINRDQCMSKGGDRGVRFRSQSKSEEYRWGDLADYDPNIFDAYVKNPGGLGTEAAFQFDKSARQFRAGEDFTLTVLYDSSARHVVLERMSRCANNRVVWEKERSEQVQNRHSSSYPVRYYDSGPNGNGDQFFRTLVYGKDGHLMGWSIDRVFLSGFSQGQTFASDDTCQNAS